MSRIRIKSNPYKKKISYEYFDESDGQFIEINYNNSPSSKLVSENYKNILLNMNAKKILEAIWDTYYNKDENIQLIFCGTDKEYEILKLSCQDEKYENKINLEKGELKLKNESEINEEIRIIAKNLGLEARVDPDNVYNTINDTISLFNEEQKSLKEKIGEMDKKLCEINSSNDTSINLLLETIDRQKKMKLEYTQRNKPDIEKITKEYNKSFVLDKKSLEKKYDSINEEVKAKIKEAKQIDTPTEESDDESVKKNIFSSIISNTKKMALKGVDMVKTGAQTVAETDKKFIEEINKMLATSIENISTNIRNDATNALKDREMLLKSGIEEIINQKFNSSGYFNSGEIFGNLKYTDTMSYNIEDASSKKFESLRVLHFLPGLPDLNAIRQEWELNINRYVKKNYLLCAETCENEFSMWEEKMIELLKDKIVQIDPNLKEKAEAINTIYAEQSKLNNRILLVNSEIDKVNLLIDYS